MQTPNYSISQIYSFEEFLAEAVLKKLAPDLERPEEVDGLLIPPDFFTKKGFADFYRKWFEMVKDLITAD